MRLAIVKRLCTLDLNQWFPNRFQAVAHLSLSAERRGPLSQNNKKIYTLSLLVGTNMSKQNRFIGSL